MICGRIGQLDRLLTGPLTGRPCVFYRCLVQEYRSSGKSGHWHTIIEEHDSVDFLVEDRSGVARVEVSGAEPALVLDAHFRSGTFNDARPELEAYLARYGERSTGRLGFNKSIRYREGVLEPGETVAAMGKARLELDSSPDTARRGYRSRPQRPVLGLTPEGHLLLSDDPSVIDTASERFTGAAAQAGGGTHSLACPHCGERSGFRSTTGEHVCLSCSRSFQA
jgi:hypothetical protein